MAREISGAYPSAIYQITWEDLPDVYSDRLRRLISRTAPEQWIFEGRKIKEAPGWASGECNPLPAAADPDPLASANLRAIRIGGQFADMVGLVTAAARSAAFPADIGQLR